MQPFNLRTLLTLLLAFIGYYLAHLLFEEVHGIAGMVLRSGFFILIYLCGAVVLKLSPDIMPVWNTLRNKFPIPYLRSRK
jgi:hypothetical protein